MQGMGAGSGQEPQRGSTGKGATGWAGLICTGVANDPCLLDARGPFSFPEMDRRGKNILPRTVTAQVPYSAACRSGATSRRARSHLS